MKKTKTDTLEKRECDNWGPIPADATSLMEKVYTLRKKDLGDFTVENLRITIGQNFSLEILIPMAIEQLHAYLFVSGDMYEGDLLKVVLLANPEYWQTHPNEKREVLALCAAHIDKIHQYYDSGSILNSILEGYEAFKKM